jgi:hypothetical protein
MYAFSLIRRPSQAIFPDEAKAAESRGGVLKGLIFTRCLKSHCFTDMKGVFDAINGRHLPYNWLVSDYACATIHPRMWLSKTMLFGSTGRNGR